MYRIEKTDLCSVWGFVSIGLMVGQIGPLLSAASADIGVESFLVGRILSTYIGVSIISILFGMILSKRIVYERLIFWGCILLGIAYLCGLQIQSTPRLFAITICSGLGLGIFQIGINSIAVQRTSALLEGAQAGRLAYLQFYFGLGAIVAPLLVDFSSSQLNDWRYSYLMIGLIGPLPLGLMIWLDMKSPQAMAGFGAKVSNDEPPEGEENVFEPNGKANIQWSGMIVLGLILASIYMALETSMFNWLSFYWDRCFGADDENLVVTGARASSVFWLVFSLSRLLMGKIVEKTGAWKALMIFGSLILGLMLVWALLRPPWWLMLVLVVLISLAMGCMFPTIMTVFSRLQPAASDQLVGILFLLTTGTSAVAPFCIGSMSRRSSIETLPWMLVVISFGFLFLLFIARYVRHRSYVDSRTTGGARVTTSE